MRIATLRLSFIVGLCATCAAVTASRALAQHPGTLDGNWAVTVTPDTEGAAAGGKAFDDVITFQGSKFTAKDFGPKNGFEPVAYEEDTRRFGPSTFTAKQASAKGGTAVWKGTAAAVNVEGTLAWTKADGTKVTYTFKGEKKQ